MSYFRESFEYQPIKLFLNSNAADLIQSRGDITFDLRRNICLPNGTIGYVSLNELTIPNTNYNINSSNNTLVLRGIKNGTTVVDETFEIDKGIYTVTQLKEALNTKFASSTNDVFNNGNTTVDFDDKTSKFTFTCADSPVLVIMSTSTMNSVLGFEDGEIDASTFTGAQGSTLTTGINKQSISIVANVSDKLAVMFIDHTTPTVITLTPGIGITMGTYVGTLNGLFTAASVPITATYNATTQRVTFTNITTDIPFVFDPAPASTCFLNFGITIHQSIITGTNCTLTSQNAAESTFFS